MNLTKNNIEKLSTLEKIANGAMWWIGSIPSYCPYNFLYHQLCITNSGHCRF